MADSAFRIAAVVLLAPSLSRAESPQSPLPPRCQAAADAFCTASCFPLIKNRPCDGPMIAAAVAHAPHGPGYKCCESQVPRQLVRSIRSPPFVHLDPTPFRVP